MPEVLLRTEGICKSFSSVPVLKQINLEIYEGEILGLIGENGAGKSTLMKILAGIHAPSSGTIVLKGKPVDIRTPQMAKLLGISLIPQEFNLVKDLSVWENLFLGSEKCTPFGLLDKKRMQEHTQELLSELNVSIPPTERIEALSAAQKQLFEIAKALPFDAILLIMD
jgi:ribose transport system ATP-binding protein